MVESLDRLCHHWVNYNINYLPNIFIMIPNNEDDPLLEKGQPEKGGCVGALLGLAGLAVVAYIVYVICSL